MGRNKPFFSIVIPTYNRATYIEATLQSIFEQTFTDYEVIVVDNKSTDNSIEVLSKYVSKEQIVLIQNDKNYERAKSRNVGMKAAKGDFLTFLDSDDFMYPDNLHDAYDFIQKNPDKSIFHNLYELVDQSRKKIYSFPFKPLINSKKSIANGNFLSCIGVFINRDIYQKIFWDESAEITGSEDYDYWLRVICEHPNVGRIQKVNSGILHHDERTINIQPPEVTESRFKYMIAKYLDDKKFLKFYRNYFQVIQSNLWLFQSGIDLRSNNSGDSMSHLTKALKLNPKIIFQRNFLGMFSKNMQLILNKWQKKQS